MKTDRQGNALTGATQAAVDLYDEALEAFQLYRGDPVGLTQNAIEQAPEFCMAHVLKAYFYALAAEPAAIVVANEALATLAALRLSAREQSHVAALRLIVQGEWSAAGATLNHHTTAYPHDALAIQAGHLVDFYCANSRGLRDRIARVLPQWNPQIPGYSAVLGMYAFGLEETADYARAEDVGRRAIDMQPLDSWAHHAVAHVMEMQGRPEDGIGWMTAREAFWARDDNFFKVHNWWHRALCHFELGQTESVLNLYDGPIRHDRSMVVLDMVDASALLWRLVLSGQDVGNRWDELADAWDRHADGRTYPFNDWHAVMAYLGAGRMSDVERIKHAYGADNAAAETGRWGKAVALPLIEGFAAFWQNDYHAAARHLHNVRYIANMFGGSHAQRDIIDWTLSEACIRGGMKPWAEALAHERLALKPHSRVNQNFLRRALAIPLTDAANATDIITVAKPTGHAHAATATSPLTVVATQTL